VTGLLQVGNVMEVRHGGQWVREHVKAILGERAATDAEHVTQPDPTIGLHHAEPSEITAEPVEGSAHAEE
jgi:hypothetical protein